MTNVQLYYDKTYIMYFTLYKNLLKMVKGREKITPTIF